jgi:hypothetical protein
MGGLSGFGHCPPTDAVLGPRRHVGQSARSAEPELTGPVGLPAGPTSGHSLGGVEAGRAAATHDVVTAWRTGKLTELAMKHLF